MAPPRDNMLEAFRKLSREEDAPSEAPKPEKAKRRPKPKREKAPKSRSAGALGGSGERRPGLSELAGSLTAGGLGGLPAAMLAALLLAAAFGTGVMVGRRSAAEEAAQALLAAEQAQDEWTRFSPEELAGGAGLVPGRERGVPTEAAAPVTPEPRGPVSALMDPANEYTIVVVTYGTTKEDEDLAFGAYDHLAEAGLPVFDPYKVGDHIVLLVGAAPRSEDLAELETRVRGLSRNGRARVYGDAYRVRIDRYVKR